MKAQALEIIAEFQVDDATTATTFGVRVRVGANEATVIGYNVQQQQLWVDRTHSGYSSGHNSGQGDFNPHFAALYRAPLSPMANTLRLHILVDTSSVEVFGNDGVAAITALIFPTAASVGVELFAERGEVILRALDVYELNEAY